MGGRFIGAGINPNAVGGKGFFGRSAVVVSAPVNTFDLAPAGQQGVPGCPCNPLDVGFSSFGGFGVVNPTSVLGVTILAFAWAQGGTLLNFVLDTNLAQNAFTTLTVPNSDLGVLTFTSATATYLSGGGLTSWSWNQPPQPFTAGNNYTVNLA